ncbi:MAG: thioredoxin domain-containing protein [Bifidobacteriaceae bacterium]|jgi:protein-disulfide isomerase|nr:thioredoxin domain-containing protein [Bifidobacteriaceae bacterium]
MAKKNPGGPPVSAKVRQREAARAEALRIQAERAAKARRSRILTIASLLGGLVIVAALVIVILQNGPSNDPDKLAARPVGSLANGGIVMGQDGVAGASAPEGDDVVTVDVYSDYMCPYCGLLEKATRDQFKELRESGEVRLVLHPVALLDGYSNDTQYSTRATDAAAAVAAFAPDKFLAFHEILFDNQPDENTDGLSDDEIAQFARDVGVPEDVVGQFAAAPLDEWVKAATEASGLTGTPVVTMRLGDGEEQRWNNWRTGDLRTAVQRVKDGQTPDE